MNLYLLVIDGLGMWCDNHESTINKLMHNFNTLPQMEMPFLSKIGINKASYGKGNLMSQLSKGVGSLEGHREMLGHISTESYDILDSGIPLALIKKFNESFCVDLIGTVQGRGQELLPLLWTEHIARRCPIVYTGFDSTIVFACEYHLFTMDKLIGFAKWLQMELFYLGFKIRKIIIRQYMNTYQKQINEKELFFPVFIENLSLDGFKSIIGNKKIGDMITLPELKIENCENDQECFDYLYKTTAEDNGFYFFNLGDFDKYAHLGEKDKCLRVLNDCDSNINKIYNMMNKKDYMIIVSDHGVDYSGSSLSSAHLREDALLLVFNGEHHFLYSGVHSGYTIVRDIINSIVVKRPLTSIGFDKVQ